MSRATGSMAYSKRHGREPRVDDRPARPASGRRYRPAPRTMAEIIRGRVTNIPGMATLLGRR